MRPPAVAVPIALLLAAAALAADVPGNLTGTDLRKEHASRRATAAAALPPGALAIVPADPTDSGSLYAPRQDEDYAWLTGIDETGGILLLSPPPRKGGPPDELLLLPPRNVRAEGWIGPRWYPGKEAEEALGIAATEDVRKAVEVVKERLKAARSVLLPRSGASGEMAEKLFGDLLRERKVPVQDLRPLLGGLRLVKSAEEVARIRRASELSAEGHRRAMATALPGMPEYAVQAVLEAACREGGCRRQAYDSIVGSGPNACVLHYGRNRRVLEDGDLVLVDAAGEFLGYASDVTRTWPVAAKFTAEQAKAYDGVLAAQEAGIAAAKPGATFKDIESACKAVFKERGLEAAWRHGPCHWVGLNVHDPNGGDPHLPPLGPGVVFTIEPGAYFPEKGWGIRIEDTFAMKADGTLDCLSKDAPKDRAAIEALRAAALGK
jgi:Xaa-Pro aminopeptidase